MWFLGASTKLFWGLYLGLCENPLFSGFYFFTSSKFTPIPPSMSWPRQKSLLLSFHSLFSHTLQKYLVRVWIINEKVNLVNAFPSTFMRNQHVSVNAAFYWSHPFFDSTLFHLVRCTQKKSLDYFCWTLKWIEFSFERFTCHTSKWFYKLNRKIYGKKLCRFWDWFFSKRMQQL